MVRSGVGVFKPGFTITLLTAAAVMVFLALGNWQLRRAAEKQALLDLQTRQLQLPPIRLQGGESLARLGRYRRVVVTGTWDPEHQFLLDGRIHQGRAGYEVLTPLQLDGDGVILVNRGWVPASGDRYRLPPVTVTKRRVTVRGRVDRFPQAGMDLPGMRQPTPGWPAVVQILEPRIAAARLGKTVADYQIKMDPDLPDGYRRDWRLEHVRPQRHIGYAIQWFSFAAIALGLWIWHGVKRARRQIER